MIRTLFVVVLVIGVLAVLAASFVSPHSHAVAEKPSGPATGSPVLVELFTSEGCSSCPPADKLLGELDRAGALDGIPVIALSEHVDYWDGLGWRDRFSSRQFTDRQNQIVQRLKLDSAYTPQMVVDGRLEFVGNDESALRKALSQAAHAPKTADVRLSWDGNKLNVAIADSANHTAAVLLALTESNLTTRVERGENGGRVLQHSAVVRRLTKLGDLKNAGFTTSTQVAADPSWNQKNLKAVVFVQDERTGAVLGTGAIAFPKL